MPPTAAGLPPLSRAVVVTAVLALALAACGDDNGGAPATTTAAAGARTTSPTTTSSATAADEEITVVVRDGDVVGGVQRFAVDLGASVSVRVDTDMTDEVHVHGYDLTVHVGPGVPAEIRFTADIPGVFEVELERRSLRIAELAVSS